MMHKLGLLIVALLTACTLEVSEPESEPETENIENDEEVGSTQPAPENQIGGCELYQGATHEIDGNQFTVPVMCEPFYFDKGDPDPTKERRPLEEQIRFSAEIANEV